MKIFLRTGIITGFVSGLWLLGCFTIVSWLNDHLLNHSIRVSQVRSYSGLFSLFILIFGIYFGIRQAKRANENKISYAQAIKTGIGISFVTAIIVSIFTFLYCVVINPGYADFMVKEAQSELIKSGASTQDISIRLQKVKQQFSTTSQVMMAFVGQFVIGCIASAIISLLLKTKQLQPNK